MLYFSALIPFLMVIARTHGTERHCSKYHYEEKLLEKFIRMELQMENLQEQLDILKQDPEHIGTGVNQVQTGRRTTVAFFALSTNRKTYKADEILIFDKVETNLGEAYNAETGTFVVPEPGTYVLFSTVLTNNDKELWNYFAVNTRIIASLNAHGTEGRHGSGSATIVVQLEKGDIVAVKNSQPQGETYGNGYTHFGGFRLSN